MAYHISDDCISCGACEAECPVGAISAGDGCGDHCSTLSWSLPKATASMRSTRISAPSAVPAQMLALLELPSSNQSLHRKSLYSLCCADFLLLYIKNHPPYGAIRRTFYAFESVDQPSFGLRTVS